MCDRRRRILSALVQRASGRTSTSDTKIQSPATAQAYEEINIDLRPTPVYSKPHKPAPSSSPAAALASVISASRNVSSVYNNTTTTLVDNALYDVQQPPVTSSNVAETGDDVTDLTVIDNDLYERQGQGRQNSGSTDYECTLVDNDLYR